MAWKSSLDSDGRVRGDQVRVIDFDNAASNDWLAVNQFTVTEDRNTRWPDIVLFGNGLLVSKARTSLLLSWVARPPSTTPLLPQSRPAPPS